MPDIQGTTDPVAKFNMFSGVLKAGGGDGEPMTLSGVASSTVEDLHGDNIQRSGLKDMERQIEGMTIFRNHSYSVPEDVMGTATGGRVVKRGEDENGNAVYDFDIDMTINDANPLAIESWEAIKKGTKLGFSIGANIPNGEFEVDRKTGAKTIKRIQLLETSIVGIPANPRSWISRAVEFIDVALAAGDVTEEAKDAPPADDRDDPEWTELDAPVSEEPDASSPSDADDSDPDSAQMFEDDSEPEAGEAPLEGEPVAPEPAISESAELQSHLTDTVLTLAQAVDEVKAARKERDEALQRAKEAERERDETVESAKEILIRTGAAVRKFKNTPVGRKTTFVEATKDLENIERVYGPDIIKMMENNSHE